MKATITVGFSSTVQAVSFNPVTSTDSLTMEVEYTDDKDLEKKIESYQKLIRQKTIKNVMRGVEEVIVAKAKTDLSK
jgi:hypothetical protein